MPVLKELKPKKVWKYFEELCEIPHGSSNTKMISDYCVNFAKEHKLRYIQDNSNNVIIFKNGTAGYEKSDAVIIQGHLDMVCEKEKDCEINMDTEGLKLYIEDGMVKAQGTTLGGDDGIAIAYALAVLDSEDIPHPPIEAVFTVDEEIGMLGAADIDCSELRGNVMLNIDSEEEGHLLVSCAGGVTASCHIPIKYDNLRITEKYVFCKIIVNGLNGGHSGVEIDKGRANANQIMGRILNEISDCREVDLRLIDINGGLKDNAIPRECLAKVAFSAESAEKVKSIIEKFNYTLKNEYKGIDDDIKILLNTKIDKVYYEENNSCERSDGTEYVQNKEVKNFTVMTAESSERIIAALVNLPGGVQKMSRHIKGLVQTSLNMGILKTDSEKNEVVMSFSVRSSIGSEKYELIKRMKCLMKVLKGNLICTGEYPAWEYKEDSKLRKLMEDIYYEQYGKKAIVEAIHAGVECGLFAGKINNLDCVSFGPDIFDIHTTSERMSIESVERTWKFILEILKRLK